MEKHNCIECIHNSIDSICSGEDDIMWYYCELNHNETHEECGCNPYDGKIGNLVECEDFKPYPQ